MLFTLCINRLNIIAKLCVTLYAYTKIHNILEDQANICGADCQIYNIGESYEGRQLKLIKVQYG